MLRTLQTVVIALTAGLVFAGCASTQEKDASGEVEVKLRRVEVVDASFDHMDLKIVVAVVNGGNTPVSISGGEASLAIAGKGSPLELEDESAGDAPEEASAEESDDEELDEDEDLDDDDEDLDDEDDEDDGDADTSGIVDGTKVTGKAAGITAASYETTEVEFAVRLPLPTDPEAFEELLSWGNMEVDVEGTLTLDGHSETFGGRREVHTPAVPTVKLDEAQIASVDAGRKGTAFFAIGIDNPNVFEIKVDKIAWGVSVGGKVMREPGEGAWETVPPSSVNSLSDNIELDEETYGKEVKELLGQPTVPYVIEGFMEVKGLRKEFRFEGEMEFAR
jgi:LEA14-like dessication related protein